jgi:hypothetical protein
MSMKTILGILLFLSMILVLYPPIATLIDTQNSINELSRVFLFLQRFLKLETT